MQKRSRPLRAVEVTCLLIVATVMACSAAESSLPTSSETKSSNGGSDTSKTTTPPTTPGATSSGPVATVAVSPQQISLKVGYYGQAVATPRDAQGVLVSGKRATWSSSNVAIVVASDTGVIFAKAVGTAKVYGTIDGKTDSATVVVTGTVPPVVDTIPKLPVPVGIASFNLAIDVQGAITGTDTTKTQPLAGVTIVVTRVSGIAGDSLNPGAIVATLTTSASGSASANNLPGGVYQFSVTPAAGSGYRASSFAIGAPTTPDVKLRFTLSRAP